VSIGRTGTVNLVRLLANEDYKWFYWAAPLLMLGAVGAIFALGGGYIKKVLIPKHRGRRVEE
jgi:hypothetical protein